MFRDDCPRCLSRSLIVECYRVASSDRLEVRAYCTSCGHVWVPDPSAPSHEVA